LLERLDAPPVGEIAGNFGVAAQLALPAVDGREDDMRPEGAAVLAHAQPLVLVAAELARLLQLLLGPLLAPSLLGIEEREVPADDFRRRVSLDALGPGVPAGDPALAIEHVNRVVAHALHQHAEALFALAQALLALAPVRKVARDLAESAHRARLVAQRRDHHVRPEARAVLAP